MSLWVVVREKVLKTMVEMKVLNVTVAQGSTAVEVVVARCRRGKVGDEGGKGGDEVVNQS